MREEQVILHCMKKAVWEKIGEKPRFGEAQIAADGFIHCSSVGYFWRVAPNFEAVTDDLVLLLIDTERLEATVKWEDPDGLGRAYPHVYGLISREAVAAVLPYLKDEGGQWIKNEELRSIPDR